MNWRAVGGLSPPIPICTSPTVSFPHGVGTCGQKTAVECNFPYLPSACLSQAGANMPTYPNGYKGAVLKTDVLWRTWLVGSNPTVGVTPAEVYLPKSIPLTGG